MSNVKLISLERKKRRFNDEAMVTIDWEKKATRNNKMLLSKINSITDHKFNKIAFDRFMNSNNCDGTVIWQDLNKMSTEFTLISWKYNKDTCCCGKSPINDVYTIKHQNGDILKIGNCCINRVFPTLKRVNMSSIKTKIKNSILECKYPMLLPVSLSNEYSILFEEVFNLIDPQDHSNFVNKAKNCSVLIYKDKPYFYIEITYHLFMITFLYKAGLSYLKGKLESLYEKSNDTYNIIHNKKENEFIKKAMVKSKAEHIPLSKAKFDIIFEDIHDT